MSEYIDIETELGDDGVILFHTNLKLTTYGAEEFYDSAEGLEEGSPVAQALVVVDGIQSVWMRGGEMSITSQPGADWHALIADVNAALKDFFL